MMPSKQVQRGFSLLELMIVLLITMVVAAMAVPTISTALANYRLKQSASSVASLLQQARIQSVRLNRPLPVTLDSGGKRIYIDMPTSTGGAPNGSYDAGEPMMQFPRTVSFQSSGNPGDATTDFTAAGVVYSSTAPRFNGRGLPCVMVTSGTSQTCLTKQGANTVAFVYYLRGDQTFGATSWAAVLITPLGRIRSLSYSGGKYQ
ncbi:MAG TPA: GspH/FimT family pseudopilin [Clostridia bacterium]|nr:GspH/FimT family pseudopilin [Clostridia bacterium]